MKLPAKQPNYQTDDLYEHFSRIIEWSRRKLSSIEDKYPIDFLFSVSARYSIFSIFLFVECQGSAPVRENQYLDGRKSSAHRWSVVRDEFLDGNKVSDGIPPLIYSMCRHFLEFLMWYCPVWDVFTAQLDIKFSVFSSWIFFLIYFSF